MKQHRWFLGVILISAIIFIAGLTAWVQPSRATLPAPRPTTPAGDFSYHPSPDSRWTAIINQTAGSLDLRRQVDGKISNILPPGSTVSGISWSPDSQRLLIVRNNWAFAEARDEGFTAVGPIEIWQVDIQGPAVQPARLAFQSSAMPQSDDVEQIVLGDWSPDSRSLLFWLGPLGASIQADGLMPYVLNIEIGQASRVADWALLNPRYHSWSPDGAKLAITAGDYRSAQINKWLNIFDTATGQVVTVISQTEQIPGIVAWSPQGNLIAYAAVPAGQTGQEWADLMTWDNPAIAGRRIYLLDPATGQSRRLNQVDSFQDAPVWSNDGAVLYYAEQNGEELQLMAADPTSGLADPVEGAAIPLPEVAGYYGQWQYDFLLEQRPGGQLPLEVAPQAQATPGPEDQEILEFIFQSHRPQLGTLTDDFLQSLRAGHFTDFTRQNIDLTGDGQPEIVVIGRPDTFYLFAAILNRDTAGNLRELFFADNIEGKYQGQVRASVQNRRLVLDFLTATGGTGYLVATWEQRWVECNLRRCNQVWAGPLIMAERIANWQIERNFAIAQVEQTTPNTLAVTTQRFGWRAPLFLDAATPNDARRFVGPDTFDAYRRSGSGQPYRLERRTETAPGLEITRQFSQQTAETNRLLWEAMSQPFYQPDGSFDNDAFNQTLAQLWNLPAPDQPADPTWGVAPIEAAVAAHTGTPAELGQRVAALIGANSQLQCRLVAQSQNGGQFDLLGRVDVPCTVNFTRLAWADVTGDGSDELLLQTLLPDESAQVERLHVFGLNNNNLTELAVLDGFINGADGAGIRWQTTAGGFVVQAGLPLLNPDASPSFDDIRLERQFESYVWDESGDFTLVE